jgi:outer membrane protein, multidrug efflux system
VKATALNMEPVRVPMALSVGGIDTAVARGRAKSWRLAMVLLFGVSLSACAVGPDYMSPSIDLPSHWANAKPAKAGKTASLARWWRRLNDPVLDELIRRAVQGNLDVASAKARIREARATRRQAIGALFPAITGSGSASRARTAASVSNGVTVPPSIGNLFKSGFDASWELDLFGANKRSVEAATYGVDAAKDDLRATLVTLIGDVASNYAEARGYQAQISLARRTAASQRETYSLTQKKYEVGSASKVDVAKAGAQTATTEADIPTYQAGYATDVHKLSILLGLPPASLSRLMARTKPIPTPRLPLPARIPADVLTSRPDVRKAERQLAQYTAKIGEAEAALYPDISLTGAVSTNATKIGDLGKNSSIGWSLGPTLSVPIFNAGKLRAAVEVAQARRDQYYVAWRSAVLTALEDVEDALVSLSHERTKEKRLAEAARQYREAAKLSRTLYQTGTQSFLDVLDAERSLYSAEDSLLKSRVAIAKDYIALAKALGGGWNGKIDSSKPEVVDVNTGPHLYRWRR